MAVNATAIIENSSWMTVEGSSIISENCHIHDTILDRHNFQLNVFLQGMSLVPAVTELLLAELLYLQYDNPTRPIFMYINSAGVQASLLSSNNIFVSGSTCNAKSASLAV